MEKNIANLEIKSIPLTQLQGWDKNPREITDENFRRLKRDLVKYAMLTPLIVDGRDMKTVLGGNMRLKALRELADEYKITTVTCNIVHPADDNEAIMMALKDNESFGKYIKVKLAELTSNIAEAQEIQISIKEIEIERLKPIEPEEDDYEPPEDLESMVEKGDLWILGEHRLVCGDSTDPEVVKLVLDNEKSNMVFTDPPYGMGFEGSIGGDGKKGYNSRHGKIINDEAPDDDLLDGMMTNIKNFNKGAFYITYWRLGIRTILNALARNNLPFRNMIIWHKNHLNLSNSDYKSIYEPMILGWDYDYEPVFYGWGEEHKFFGEKGATDIWDVDGLTTVWEIDRTKKNTLHSTMKPIRLCGRAILNSTRMFETVLDLFGGSGSTLIACEQTGRKCRIIELDEHYCDVIIDRYKTFKETDLGISVIRNGKKLTLEEARDGKGKKTRAD